MIPNEYVKNLKEYPLTSHKAWEFADKSNIYKLDWNEADLPLASAVKDAVLAFINREPLSWYPDVANKELISVIASHVGVLDEQVQYFEGSDCGLDYTVRTFMARGDEAVLAAPTYDNFRVYVESVGGIPIPVIGSNMFLPDVEALGKAITRKTKVLYIANPNNPTGTFYSQEDIERLLVAHPTVLLILDEAYAEFTGSSCAPLVMKYPNLVVSRSLSKAFGLASFRIGYIVSSSENISYINKIRNGKNIAAISQIAAIAALRNRSYMEAYVSEVRSARAMFATALKEMGVDVIETIANFILMKVKNPEQVRIFLLSEKVFVRGLTHLPGMEGYLRITIGRVSTTEQLLGIFKKLKENHPEIL